ARAARPRLHRRPLRARARRSHRAGRARLRRDRPLVAPRVRDRVHGLRRARRLAPGGRASTRRPGPLPARRGPARARQRRRDPRRRSLPPAHDSHRQRFRQRHARLQHAARPARVQGFGVPPPLLPGWGGGGPVRAVILTAVSIVSRAEFRRFASGAMAVAVVAAISNAFLYGNPLPYIGYFLAVVYPQELTKQTATSISFVSFEFWIGLPGMLFDRVFGIAGVAPWLFIAVIGIPAALRANRRVFAPAAITLGLSLLGLSLYHFWEGGYAPPARYFVDVLPLVAPFVAYGL